MMRRLSPGVYQGGQGRVFQAQNRAQAQQMAGVRQRPQPAPTNSQTQAPQFQPAPPGMGASGFSSGYNASGYQPAPPGLGQYQNPFGGNPGGPAPQSPMPNFDRAAMDRAFQFMGQQQGGGGYGSGFASQGQMNDYNSGLNREMQGFGGTEDPRLAAMKQRFQQQNPQQQPYNNMAAMNPMQKPGGL